MTIFKGPVGRNPHTISKDVSGALLPGTIVENTGAALAQITTAVAKRPLVLAAREFFSQDVTDAYVSGDTAHAYDPSPGDVYRCRMAAATYAYGAPLTVAAAGRLAAAGAGTIVVAWFASPGATLSAGDFADVIWANSYTAA